jgi:hypothetical protein
MKFKDVYMKGRKVILNNGILVRFSKDIWCGDAPLSERFPALFDICQKQDCLVKFSVYWHYVLPFRRHIHGEHLVQWNQILQMFGQVNLNASPDMVKWSLGKSDVFSTKSIYQFLERDMSGHHNKWIWKANIPLKIKFFYVASVSGCYFDSREHAQEKLAWCSPVFLLWGG